MKSGKRLAVLAAAILAAVVAGWQLNLSHSPNTGKNIYGSEASFDAYVAGLGLASATLEDAKNRLMVEGFRCELFADGAVGCHRKVQGSNCGEQQFVDLKPAGTGGAGPSVSGRFALVCR